MSTVRNTPARGIGRKFEHDAPAVHPVRRARRACSDTLRDIGWPGHAVLSALVEEVITLRAAAKELQKIHEDLQEIVADQGRLARSQESELRKWRTPGTDASLAWMREQYERSDARETGSKVAYINALTHALVHAREALVHAREEVAAMELPKSDSILLHGRST